MPALADIQLFLRDAIVKGDTAGIRTLLAGGPHPENGLGIHRRNYEVSLVSALLTKFPATVWLAGTSFVSEAARRFVRDHPPQAPCIAEYGDEFPKFLAALPGAQRLPYLTEFAELERQVGQVAVEIEEPRLALADLSDIAVDRLPDLELRLQPGVCYREASWPIDDLLKLYLTETAPDRYTFEPFNVWLEVRGARGEFYIDRLESSDFIFRKSIRERRSIGTAAECTLEADPRFDPGIALVRLMGSGLVTEIQMPFASDEKIGG